MTYSQQITPPQLRRKALVRNLVPLTFSIINVADARQSAPILYVRRPCGVRTLVRANT